MVRVTTTVLEARILTDRDWIGVTEVCRMYHIEQAEVAELAELGVIAPRETSGGLQVPATELPRLRVVARLMRDLGINVSGAALAVELLEARRALERRIRDLEALT